MFFRLSKFFLYTTVFAVVLVTTSTLFPFIVGKYTFFRTAVYLAAIFFLLGLMLDPDADRYFARLKQIYRSPLTWALSAFVFFFVLAGFTGLQPSFSFWSNFERGEGGFQLLTLYIYFVLLAALFQREEEWRRLFWCAVIGALLMVGYGTAAGLKYLDADIQIRTTSDGVKFGQLTGTGGPLFQLFKNFVGPEWKDLVTGGYSPAFRFQGTIGNPAYVAAYLLFIFFYMAALFFRSRAFQNYKKGIVYLALLLIFVTVFYFSGTRGGLVGLLGGTVVFALFLAYTRKPLRPWAIGAVLALICVAVVLISLRNNPVISKLPGMRIFDISLSTAQMSAGAEGTFSTRSIMWSIAWNACKDKPLLGYGPENFIQVFDRYFNPHYFVPAEGFKVWFDRAHSIYLDYLSQAGALGLLSFLGIFAVIGWLLFRAARRGESNLTHALLAGSLTAYLVQGIVLFDVLVIYINLFLVLAFAFYIFTPVSEAGTHTVRRGAPLYGFAGAGIILAFLGMYLGALLPYVKASRYIRADQTADQIRDERDFERHFDYVMDFYSPVGKEETAKFLSAKVLGLLPQLKGPAAEPVARAIVNYMERHLLEKEVRHLLIRAQMRYVMWREFRKPEDFEATEAAFLKAHEIGPKLPQPLYGLYQIYSEAKNTAKAQEVRSEILGIWPDASSTLPKQE